MSENTPLEPVIEAAYQYLRDADWVKDYWYDGYGTYSLELDYTRTGVIALDELVRTIIGAFIDAQAQAEKERWAWKWVE